MVRQQMERGELSTEPENELGKLGPERKRLVSGRKETDIAPSIKARIHTGDDDVAGDEFFGDEEEEESEQSETSSS